MSAVKTIGAGEGRDMLTMATSSGSVVETKDRMANDLPALRR
jgi:hypothetical protein